MLKDKTTTMTTPTSPVLRWTITTSATLRMHHAISDDSKRRYNVTPCGPLRWKAVCRSHNGLKWDDFTLNVYDDALSAQRACEGYEESFK